LQSVNNRTQSVREILRIVIIIDIIINTLLGRLTLDPAGMHILRFSGRLAVPYFEINAGTNKCTDVSAVQWTEIWKFIQVSYIIALLDWEQPMMHRMSGQTHLAEKITTSRIYQK